MFATKNNNNPIIPLVWGSLYCTLDGIKPHRVVVECMTMWSKQREQFTWMDVSGALEEWETTMTTMIMVMTRTTRTSRMMLIIGLVRDKRYVHEYDIYLLKNWSSLRNFYFNWTGCLFGWYTFFFAHFSIHNCVRSVCHDPLGLRVHFSSLCQKFSYLNLATLVLGNLWIFYK